MPFLKAPGFCNLQAPGLMKKANFPDASGTGGIAVTARGGLSVARSYVLYMFHLGAVSTAGVQLCIQDLAFRLLNKRYF